MGSIETKTVVVVWSGYNVVEGGGVDWTVNRRVVGRPSEGCRGGRTELRNGVVKGVREGVREREWERNRDGDLERGDISTSSNTIRFGRLVTFVCLYFCEKKVKQREGFRSKGRTKEKWQKV